MKNTGGEQEFKNYISGFSQHGIIFNDIPYYPVLTEEGVSWVSKNGKPSNGVQNRILKEYFGLTPEEAENIYLDFKKGAGPKVGSRQFANGRRNDLLNYINSMGKEDILMIYSGRKTSTQLYSQVEAQNPGLFKKYSSLKQLQGDLTKLRKSTVFGLKQKEEKI